MCGIAGAVHFDGSPVGRDMLQQMIRLIAHRGPDGDGFAQVANVGLAHCRLAIIDPRGGAQPITSNDGQVILSYNGEVYNYKEIRQELLQDGPFTSDCDTEVVLRAYERWGIAGIQRFRGMFAFALFDRRAGRLYLVRDRVGIKPLYYANSAKFLLFASELLPLARTGKVSGDVDQDALAGYFRYQYVPAPQTIYAGVRKLEPGHYLEVDVRTGRVTDHCYWDLNIVPVSSRRSEADLLEELNHRLQETVNLYVRSDVPFGAFLSGGIDSSLVTGLMSRCLNEPVRTFSIGYREEAFSELPYALEASNILGTQHYPQIVRPDFSFDFLSRLASHFGEPFGDSSAVPTYWVSRVAASKVKMVLSGDGGDELFAGYNTYRMLFSRRPFRPRRLVGMLLRAARGQGHVTAMARRLGVANLQRRHNDSMDIYQPYQIRRLLQTGGQTREPPLPPCAASDDPLALFQWQDFKTYMVDDVLTKVDRMSMANSLEVRVPLLDHELVEFAFSLPPSLRLRPEGDGSFQSKYLLRQTARRFFPQSFLDRPKMGFGIPIVDWLDGPLWGPLNDTLLDRRNPIYNWLHYPAVVKILDRYHRGFKDNCARLWLLLMFDLWTRNVHLAQAPLARAA